MKVELNPNSCLFKNKSKAQIIQLISKYQKYYKDVIKQFILDVGIDSKYINSIIAIPNNPTYGTTIPLIKDKEIYFDIEISDELMPYITLVPNTTEKFKAKSVIQHELFHCKEIKYLHDCNALSNPSPSDNNFKITTTYDFLYDEAVNLWSEFYAVYHNRKINEWHEIPYIKPDIQDIDKWFNAMIVVAKSASDNQAKFTKDMLHCLRSFWYHMISLIALHINTNEDLLIEDYITSEPPLFSEYFKHIYSYLKELLGLYPNWLSEENYISFGKTLFSIINYYHFDFSTPDLSDNFILKYAKES